jgi:hypothetical protein
MLGTGSPPQTFAPTRPAADAAGAYSRAEFRDGSGEWLRADAASYEAGAASGHAPARRGLARWLAWASAAASKFAGVFL